MRLHCLKSPLQLPGGQSLIVMRLQAIAAGKEKDRNLCGRKPVTAICHCSQADGKTTSSFPEVFVRLPRLGGWLYKIVGIG